MVLTKFTPTGNAEQARQRAYIRARCRRSGISEMVLRPFIFCQRANELNMRRLATLISLFALLWLCACTAPGRIHKESAPAPAARKIESLAVIVEPGVYLRHESPRTGAYWDLLDKSIQSHFKERGIPVKLFQGGPLTQTDLAAFNGLNPSHILSLAAVSGITQYASLLQVTWKVQLRQKAAKPVREDAASPASPAPVSPGKPAYYLTYEAALEAQSCIGLVQTGEFQQRCTRDAMSPLYAALQARGY